MLNSVKSMKKITYPIINESEFYMIIDQDINVKNFGKEIHKEFLC
jgi:hypothetical protein